MKQLTLGRPPAHRSPRAPSGASALELGSAARTGGAVFAVLVVFYFVTNAIHPLGPGIVLKGIVTGGLSSLVAMGLVLIYRSSRIINFSQQVIGGLAATVSVLLVAGRGYSYWVAVPVGLVVAVLTGWLVEAVFIRRFAQAPRLILTVATIGIYQLLGAAELGLPNLITLKAGAAQTLTTPFTFHFFLSPFNFTGDDLLALVAVPVALAFLYWFFVRTDYGVAIRAAADSGERALLLGIPVRRLSRITWMVAAGLSGVGAILSAPKSISGFTLGSVTSPATLLLPLAAAVLAGMESLPATVAWSLVLGVVNEAVYAVSLQASYQDVAQFVVIILGLLITRSRRDRQTDGGLGDFVAIREVAGIPHHLARLREVVATRVALGVVLVVAAVLVPLTFSQSKQLLAADVAIYAMIGVSIVVLTGWAGQISLGQFAFVGVGAATAGSLMVSQHANFFVATLAAAAVGALVAVIIGIPALRIPGLYLAVATLAFAVPVSSYVLSSSFFPSINPTQVPRPVLFGRFDLGSQSTFYEVCLVGLLLVILAVRNLRTARTGRVVIAARDNAQAASAYAISPLRTKLLAFVISGAIAGVAGSLYELSLGGIKSGGLSPDLSITVFVMVVIGGLGSITGAVIGAVYVQSVQYFLPQSLQLLATGAGLLLLLMFFPEGLGGVAFRIRDWWLARVESRQRVAAAPAGSLSELPGAEDQLGAAHAAALRIGAFEELEERGDVSVVGVAPDAGPPSGRRALVDVEGVEAGYTSRARVLHGVDFGVAQSEVVALLGTNGAGKTTVLRTIAGLLNPSKGRVDFVGQALTGTSASDRVRSGIVTVLGGRGIFPSLTVAENLRLATWTARRHHRDPEFAEAASERVLTLFPVLRTRRNQRAGLLSGGERQMLALAQALLCRPKVLLIDELSLGLAPNVVLELLEVIRALAASGVTVVIVEQSVNVATAISSRAIFMERGRIRFSGPTPDLSQQPRLLRSVFLQAAKRAQKRTTTAPPRQQPTDGRPLLSVSGVSKHFGGLTALSDITLDVRPGEIVGIIGSNGAGKTTLFDVCSGFTAPDRGRVLLRGEDITSLSPAQRAARGLGRVFQDARLFPSLTVVDALATALERSVPVRDPLAEALGLGAVARSEYAVRERVEELLAEMGLERFRDRFVSELSTGTRRVVELACALAHQPRVLLLDEPTAGIAQRESEALADLLLALRDQSGAAFILIEHDVPLVSSVADRLLCFHVGEVISEGPTFEVLNDPAVVAAYLGTEDGLRRHDPSAGGPVGPGRGAAVAASTAGAAGPTNGAASDARVPAGVGAGAPTMAAPAQAPAPPAGLRGFDPPPPPAAPGYGTPPAAPGYGTPPAAAGYGTPPPPPAGFTLGSPSSPGGSRPTDGGTWTATDAPPQPEGWRGRGA
jgi:ABC-type branched-subunit amino acid transport system ATPase component/ABC-type branched-subunit amino acid transport system permease subunit